jgi:hypothetical protein
MQFIQIDGTFTFAQNIKELKIGDLIKLQPNPSNRINKDAIGAHTTNGSKIGYVPFKSNQIDLKAKYKVAKINLTQNNPVLLIARDFDQSNFIITEPEYIKNIKYTGSIINRTGPYLKDFKKFLENSQVSWQDIGIEFEDQNYINLIIETSDCTNRFYTVTKKYWEENVFKYDEFFKFKLIPKCIYQPFQIHRLESYIEKNYKPIDKLLKSKKFKLENLLKENVLDGINNELGNYGFETIFNDSLQMNILNKKLLLNFINNKDEELNLIKLIFKYNICSNEYLSPTNYLKYLNPTNNHNNEQINMVEQINLDLDLDSFKNFFNDLKVGGLCYNHTLKKYCDIDLYDDINIIEISTEKTITEKLFVELLIKLLISDKQIVNLYNPLKGIIFRLELNDLIKNNLLKLF